MRSEERIEEALGQSEPFLNFQDQIARVAPVERSVLLIGERGTGKELAANRLHYLSKRWDGPFVTLNCSTLSPNLIESELFGHEKGAFTGAELSRKGRFELAHGGTIFLDEIGTIPMEAQEKILRVVEYGSFERVGGTLPVEVDVRIIGATNADLPEMTAQGKFKPDLLDRLSFEVLTLPPLRHRDEDVMILANFFARRIGFELGREQLPSFTRKAVQRLQGHGWPGNVRELKNVVERAVYRSESDVIDTIVFNPFASPYGKVQEVQIPRNVTKDDDFEHHENVNTNKLTLPFKQAVRQYEIDLIASTLVNAKYNQRVAATLLGLSYDQFRGLVKKYKNELGL